MSPPLPPSLARWREQLALLPVDLALSLGGPLSLLARLVGRTPLAGTRPGGEPSGFAGLSRRGPYERLLASEWLLAEEIPEEFDRRAVMAEHLFFELAFEEPRESGRCLALFDGGPEQLGAPRIAQLATLILLAERATALGQELAWGTIQDPDLRLSTGLDEAGLARFLTGRARLPAKSEQLERWRERLDNEVPAAPTEGERWLVGDRSLLALASAFKAAVVSFELPLEPGCDELKVEVFRSGCRPRDARLGLPEPSQAVRLLREVRQGGQPPAKQRGIQHLACGPLRFGAAGQRLLGRQSDGKLASFHIPHLPQAEPGRTRYYGFRSAETLIAASIGAHSRQLLAVVLDGRTLVLYGSGARHKAGARPSLRVSLPADLEITPPALEAPLPPVFVSEHTTSKGQTVSALFVDGADRLFELKGECVSSLLAPDERVIGFTHGVDEVLVASRRDLGPGGSALAVRCWRTSSSLDTVYAGDVELGADDIRVVTGCGVIAVGLGLGDLWLAVRPEGINRFFPGSEARPVAVAFGARHTELGLVLLEADRRTLTFVSQSSSHTICRAPEQVSEVVADASWQGLLALRLGGPRWRVVRLGSPDQTLGLDIPRLGSP